MSITMSQILYASGSQPVVLGPPVVRGHLPGGPQARPNIYLILRNKYVNRTILAIFQFFPFHSLEINQMVE